MGRDKDGIWFRSPTLVVFQMYPVVTLEELKSVILCNMGLGAVGTLLVRRVAYRLLNVFPPDPFKFKIFWVDSDEHVRALFDLHRRYETREVMELLTEMQSMPWYIRVSLQTNQSSEIGDGNLARPAPSRPDLPRLKWGGYLGRSRGYGVGMGIGRLAPLPARSAPYTYIHSLV
ncbi:hypothetical protein PIB30_037149 [Stylosanthes scabra]|uniref:Uncharacterized protein n=1 Tax=Stylosanthes scabra TaxID=79078 RepID=A0ABU6SDF5_9FABA|nr:hypothetical protein [Stylosanthes scabra]